MVPQLLKRVVRERAFAEPERTSRVHQKVAPYFPCNSTAIRLTTFRFSSAARACQKLAGLRPMSHSAKASRLAPTHFTSDTLHLSGLKPWAHSRASLPSSSCERLQ